MKNRWEILSLRHLIINLFSPIHISLSNFMSGGQDHVGCPLKEWSAVGLFFCVGLRCGQERFEGARRLPFPYGEPLALEANTGGNPASTHHCTSPYSEGCAVGWAPAERAAGRSRHCFLQVTGGRGGPWACPRGFVTAQIQCPAWGLRNHFHVFYWLLQFPFVVLLGPSNRAVVALILTWVFCLLVCFLPSSRNIFYHMKREKKCPDRVWPIIFMREEYLLGFNCAGKATEHCLQGKAFTHWYEYIRSITNG